MKRPILILASFMIIARWFWQLAALLQRPLLLQPPQSH